MGKYTRAILEILAILTVIWLVDTFFLVFFNTPRYSSDRYLNIAILFLILSILIDVKDLQIKSEKEKE